MYAIAATAAVNSSPLLAQELEVIVVTATKQGETALQDTPLSITALGGDALISMGADSASDFLRSVPGMVFEEQGIGDKKYSIRGVQSVGAATVAVYFDDIALTANNAQDGGGRNVDPKLVDIERIEVLRGPQGTLYGASAMTGTVRYIYNKPDLDAYRATVSAQAASTRYGEGSYDFDGVLNLPLIRDELGLRLVAYTRDDSGWIDRHLIGQEDVNNEETEGFRAHALWDASSALTLTGTFMHQESSSDGRSAWQEMSPNDPPALQRPCTPRQTCTGEITRSGQNDKWSAYNLTANYATGFGNFFVTSSLLDRDFVRGLDNTVIIALIRGVRLPDGSFNRFDPRARHMIQQVQSRSLWSTEARFSSEWQGPLQLIAGVFHQKDSNSFDSNVGSTDRNGNFAADPVRDNSLWRTVDNDIEHSALFSELSYQVTEKLTGTVGARYYKFDVEEESNSVVACCSGNRPGAGPGPLTHSSDNGVNMKYNLSYKVTEQAMVYAQAAQGFRSGGTNEPSIVSLPICNSYGSYGSDNLWNYELGIKSSWLDNRVTANFTPYYISWSGMQVRTNVRECLSSFMQNAGSADIYGAEFETAWQATENFNLTLALGYADAKLSGDQPFQAGPLVDGRDGDRIPDVPDLTTKLGLMYTIPLTIIPADLQLRTDWSFTGSSTTAFRDTDSNQRTLPSYHLLDLRVNLLGQDGWRTSLFIKNVLNDLSDLARFPSSFEGDYVFSNRPRQIGVAVSKDFF